MACFFQQRTRQKAYRSLLSEMESQKQSWSLMTRLAAVFLPVFMAGVVVTGGSLDRPVGSFSHASLQPLVVSGLERVVTHLQVSAQIAHNVAHALGPTSSRRAMIEEQAPTLLHMAHSLCQPACLGAAFLSGDANSGSQWVGHWAPHLQERIVQSLESQWPSEPAWQPLQEGDTEAIHVVPVPSLQRRSTGAVIVAVELKQLGTSLEALELLQWGSFVVADLQGQVYAAAHGRHARSNKKAGSDVVPICAPGRSSWPRCKLEGKDHFVVVEHRTVHGLRLQGVLVLPSALPARLSFAAPYLGIILRVLALLIVLGGALWVTRSVHAKKVEDALQVQMMGHLDDKKRAEAANSAKSAFLANMSHELRTPMAAILLGLDLVLEAGNLALEQEASLMQVKHCASELLHLLNDILDLGKIESGKFQLEAVDFDLAHEIQSVVDMFGIQCAGKGIIIGLEVADEMERIVNGDPLRFRQILGNLISNSIKFTPPGGSIYVSAQKGPRSDAEEGPPILIENSEDTPWWQRGPARRPRKELEAPQPDDLDGNLRFQIEVNDTGCGLPKEKRETVFENFTQADSSTTRMHGGTGLGLGITKKLVQMMGGNIAFMDKEGPGCLVRVQLTLAPPLEPVKESPSHLLLHAPIPRTLQGAKIVLAMPPHLSRKLAEKWLRERGFDLHVCSSVQELMDGIKAGTLFPGFSPFPPAPSSPALPSSQQSPTSPLSANELPSSPPTPAPKTTPPLVIVDFAMVQAAAVDNLLPPGSPSGPSLHFRTPPGVPLYTSSLLGMPPVFDADSKEVVPEPNLGPPEVMSELARLKAEMGSNIVWLLDPNTPPAVRSGLVKSRGFALLVLRPLHAGRLSEIMRKVGVVRERRQELDQARKNIMAQTRTVSGGVAEGQIDPPSEGSTITQEATSVEAKADSLSLEKPKSKGNGAFANTLSGLHLLVVEDSPVLQRLVTSMLGKMGAKRVSQANDGKQAVAMVEQLRGSLDIVLMDCQMPILDGYCATREIREAEKGTGTRVPIIALTAHAMLSDEKKCLEAGMDSYLSKPVSPANLCVTISKLVKRKEC